VRLLRVVRSSVLAIAAGALLVWALPTAGAFANAIKLFDAVSVTNVGPVTDPREALWFGQTQLLLICPPVPLAIISSDVDGTRPVVVDNFLTVNGLNVCPAAFDSGYRNCFQRFHGGSSDASLAYVGVAAFDISSRISSGSHVVNFALEDHGGLLGSSEIWLVTNCFVWTQR
jgi:hypothetical protein